MSAIQTQPPTTRRTSNRLHADRPMSCGPPQGQKHPVLIPAPSNLAPAGFDRCRSVFQRNLNRHRLPSHTTRPSVRLARSGSGLAQPTGRLEKSQRIDRRLDVVDAEHIGPSCSERHRDAEGRCGAVGVLVFQNFSNESLA